MNPLRGRCTLGRRLRFRRCALCRRLVLTRAGTFDAWHPSDLCSVHWCGHLRCMRQLQAAYLVGGEAGIWLGRGCPSKHAQPDPDTGKLLEPAEPGEPCLHCLSDEGDRLVYLAGVFHTGCPKG